MTIDWGKAPASAEAASGLSPNRVWYRRDLYGRVFQICPSAGCEDWTSMGGRTDFPVGAVLRPVEKLAATVRQADGWDGEGLPPDGSIVEVINDNRFNIRQESKEFIGKPVRVAAAFVMSESGRQMVCVDGGVDLGCEVFILDLIKPIRTAEQIAAEERQAGIKKLGDWLCTASSVPTPYLWEVAQRVYDAGYRKQEKLKEN